MVGSGDGGDGGVGIGMGMGKARCTLQGPTHVPLHSEYAYPPRTTGVTASVSQACCTSEQGTVQCLIILYVPSLPTSSDVDVQRIDGRNCRR